jgi:hypothetical protein
MLSGPSLELHSTHHFHRFEEEVGDLLVEGPPPALGESPATSIEEVEEMKAQEPEVETRFANPFS